MKISLQLFVLLIAQTFYFFTVPGPVRKLSACFDGPTIQEHLLRLIENEKKSIDVAMYVFTNKQVAEALVSARHRGVKVRCLMDSVGLENRLSVAAYLRSNHIDVYSCDPDKIQASMHLKTWNFGSTRLNDTQPYCPCVVTGSYNCTYNGTYRNFENIVIIYGRRTFNEFRDNLEKIIKRHCFLKKR